MQGLDKFETDRVIRNITLKAIMEDTGAKFIPVGVSNRHIHLSKDDVNTLFGEGYQLTPIKDLSQPGQFACKETVSLVGHKGRIDSIRILGPARTQTQVEISLTDSFKVGVKPLVRMSGDLAESPGATLAGPMGELKLSLGVIISARHIHMAEEEAAWYGVKDGEIVKAKMSGARSLTFENILVRAGTGHSLELHIDTDEANAAGISTGDFLELIK